mmetsp:Transcript_8743/g.14117  ORF Transcript_8743/g.14117 Transcript_8743/m.14117 type:complete len:167 (-) Transcript_8743:102-602(-)
MTKTKSTGTSFTQTTQKISNITPLMNEPPTSRLRSEMAWKYKVQREGSTAHHNRPSPSLQPTVKSGPNPKQTAAASRIYPVADGPSQQDLHRQQQRHQPQQQRHGYRPATQQESPQQQPEQPTQGAYVRAPPRPSMEQQRSTPSAAYSKAIQNAKDRRMQSNQRLS